MGALDERLPPLRLFEGGTLPAIATGGLFGSLMKVPRFGERNKMALNHPAALCLDFGGGSGLQGVNWTTACQQTTSLPRFMGSK